ncbi:MAG: hypothetical protein ACJAZ3_001381 [Sphingobacteriales bacterium]|jgi:hypothetical protein
MLTNITNCSICNSEITALYCPTCGQKVTGKRTKISEVASSIISSVFNLNKGIIGNFKTLIQHPSTIVHNYFDGNRRYYYSPGQMLLLCLFVLGLHLAFVNKEILGLSISISGAAGGFRVLLSPELLLLSLLLPIFSLVTYLTFFKKKYNFAEHLASALYIYSLLIVVFTIIGDVFYLITENTPTILASISFVAFFWMSCRVFLDNCSWLRSILFTIIQLLIFALFVLGLIGLVYLQNPETINF